MQGDCGQPVANNWLLLLLLLSPEISPQAIISFFCSCTIRTRVVVRVHLVVMMLNFRQQRLKYRRTYRQRRLRVQKHLRWNPERCWALLLNVMLLHELLHLDVLLLHMLLLLNVLLLLLKYRRTYRQGQRLLCLQKTVRCWSRKC